MNRFPMYTALIWVAWLSFVACGVFAAEEDLSSGGERILNGHGFLPSEYVVDPFVGTNFENRVGGATAVNFETEFTGLDGEPLGTLTGNVLFGALGLSFQQKLGQKWAIGVGGSGLARSGTNVSSFVANGANVNTEVNAWVKRLLHRGQRSQLTVGLAWEYASATYFTPGDFARHIADGGALETAPLVTSDKVWALQGTILWAYAFNSTFGLRADGHFGVREQELDDGPLMGKNRVSLLGEADFKDRWDFPLGVTLGYFSGFPSDRPKSGLSGTLLGFWYTGKEEFVLGLEMGWVSFPSDVVSESVDGMFGMFSMKYYF